VVEKSNSKSKK